MAEDIKIEKLPVLKNAFGLDYIAPSPEDLYGTKDFTLSTFRDNDPRNALYNIVMGRGNRDTIARSPDIPVFTTAAAVPTRPEPQTALPPTFPDAAAPPPTVSNSVAKDTVKALTAGSSAANTLLEAERRADAGKGLLGGDMSGIISNLLRMFAQPEFQQAGFAGQGFGPTVLGATRSLRAMDTQDAAEQDRAEKLQAAQASAANKAAVDQMRLAMDKERLSMARRNELRQETQDRVQRGRLTNAQLEGLEMQIENDPQIKALMEALDGTAVGRLIGNSPSTESVKGYITSRVVELRAVDPSISVRDAAIQAASELANKATTASGGSTSTESTNGNGVDPFAKVGG